MNYIYIIKNKESPKVYIGQTTRNVAKRFQEHLQRDDMNTKLGQAIFRYGKDNFYYEILEEVEDKELLNEREQYWIKYYNSYDKGYNMTTGGQNMEATIKAISISVEKRDKNTLQIIEEYNSISEASRSVLKDESGVRNISQCCRGNLPTAYGYKWTYKNNPIPSLERKKNKRTKEVLMIDKDTDELIQKFVSGKEAANYLGKINGSHIYDCCNNKLKTCYGYKWRWGKE